MARPPPTQEQEQLDALNFAYEYGYPLLEYGKFVSAFPNAVANTLYHDRRLTTFRDRKVIRPNVDTLYSTIFLDFSSMDLELLIPKISNRYWCFSFYDPYGNNFGNISSLQCHGFGRYLIRFSNQDLGFSKSSTSKSDRYRGYIDVPTAYGIMFARVAVSPKQSDQSIANKLQDKINITEVKRSTEITIAPPLPLSLFSSAGYQLAPGVSNALVVLRLTAAIAHFNPPIVAEDREKVAKALFQSGIYEDPSLQKLPINTGRIEKRVDNRALAALRSDGGRFDHGNGWSTSFPDCLGLYYSNYVARYYVAKRGYLALTPDQAAYPSRSGPLVIGSNSAIILRFSRRPVLVKGGFWSLTAYTSDQYLIPNDLERYCLGDRDHMCFPDQTPLSDESKDGEFYILLQPADIMPPEVWRNNWLPAPAGGGKMSVTLRWYGATKEMLTGAYKYPELERIDAITSNCQYKL